VRLALACRTEPLIMILRQNFFFAAFFFCRWSASDPALCYGLPATSPFVTAHRFSWIVAQSILLKRAPYCTARAFGNHRLLESVKQHYRQLSPERRRDANRTTKSREKERMVGMKDWCRSEICLNTESLREDLRLTTYRLQVVERMPPGPWKDNLLRAIHQRLVALGLPVQVHGVVHIELDTAA
jgi:hypothetical protein